MSKIFALLAVILIASGALILAVPKPTVVAEKSAGRSLAPQAAPNEPPTLVGRARELAENINAPLSILFGFISLYYSRRSYQLSRLQAELELARRTSGS